MDSKILCYFPDELRHSFEKTEKYINEIRLRIGKPAAVTAENKIFYPDKNGQLFTDYKKGIIVTDKYLIDIFDAVCRYSVHSFQDNIANGFITIDGGHRVGICGSAVFRDGKVINVKNISSLNFRIAREIYGCAENIYNKIFFGGLKNVIIAGAPACGKTTVLRDLCRLLSEKHRVSLIDERGELAAVYNGIPSNNIGTNTDVFNGYSKSCGIETAVRVMSPEIVLCDEAGTDEDFRAFEYAMSCGVKIVATVHADCFENIIRRFPNACRFDYTVFLSDGKLEKTVRNDEYAEICGSFNNNFYCGVDRKLFCNANFGTPEHS